MSSDAPGTLRAAPAPADTGTLPALAAQHRCVVVGAGSIGRRHLRNLAALGIAPLALRTGRGQAGPLADVTAVQDWEAVAAWQPTMAIIANPTSLHADAAIAALRLGCHVLIEKPLADSTAAALEVARHVAERGRTALVGYQFRFHPTLARVREWISAGAIGEVLAAQVHWGEFLPGWHPGEDHRLGYSARKSLGGGVILTLSHPIDYVRWLLGDAVSVSAMTSSQGRFAVDADEVAAITLRMAGGAIVSITLDYAERPARHTLHVVGTAGAISWNALTGVADLVPAEAHRAPERAVPDGGFERNTMFLDQLRHFMACIAGAESPRCTVQDGVRAVVIASAALRSSRDEVVVDVR